MKTPSLQSAVAEFKKRIRLVAKVSTDEADEWHLATCTNVSNRLQPMAIASRQPAIQGMPALTYDEECYVPQALLAMRGINQKIHKARHSEGILKLTPKPFAFKGTSHAWMRNLKKPSGINDWTKEPALPDGPLPIQKQLKTIACPECGRSQSTKSHKLQVKVGFCQMTCQNKECRNVSSTKHWKCPCGMRWHKCEMHVQQNLFLQSLGIQTVQAVPKRGVKRFCTVRGIEQPKPQSRKFFNFSLTAILNSAVPIQQEANLVPGSKLAAKFPHLVKGYRQDVITT